MEAKPGETGPPEHGELNKPEAPSKADEKTPAVEDVGDAPDPDEDDLDDLDGKCC